MDLSKLIERIGRSSLPFDPGLQEFLSPEQRKIEEELCLTERAEKAGKDNIPKPDTKNKDSLALDIDTYLTAIVRKAKKELENHLDGLVGLDIYQTSETYANDIRGETKTALNNLRETCRNGVNKLFPGKRKLAEGELALEKFKKKHHLERPVDPSESRSRTAGVVFFLFTLELALNAYTLGTAHPEGPVGVVLETFMIAALNIAVGFTTGWFSWRQMYHRYVARRILGGVGTISLLAITFAGNLAVGHFRDAILSTSARAQELGVIEFIKEITMLAVAVQKSLFSHPLELYDTKSYLTTFVGIGLALYAAREGFKSDDRYPGYGSISRDQDQRSAEYTSLFAQLQSELIEIDKRATEQINATGKLAVEARAAKKDHAATAERLVSAFSDWTKEIGGLGAALYAKYREANEQQREEPRPPCFGIEFALSHDLIKAPSYAGSSEAEPDEDIDTLVKDCSEKIDFAMNKYLGVYKTIGALAPEDLTREFATSFDREVEEIYDELSANLTKQKDYEESLKNA